MANAGKSGKQWLKAELHAHCNLDPEDSRVCRYTPEQLISRAAGLGYGILAITCHDLDVWTRDLSDYARDLGITLIPGMEVTAEKTRHVLAYNFRTCADNLNTLNKIRARSGRDTLVIAPHPFFPDRSCLRGMLPKNLDVFDAIEYSGFQIRGLNFNRRSAFLARETGKPLVGKWRYSLPLAIGKNVYVDVFGTRCAIRVCRHQARLRADGNVAAVVARGCGLVGDDPLEKAHAGKSAWIR